MANAQPKGDLISRALAAYFRSGGGDVILDQPRSDGTYIRDHDGKQYVVITNSYRTLAVYRVRTSGLLKALRRWPAELDEW
jgi:hypothetical protein